MSKLIRTLLSRELFVVGVRNLRAHKLRSFLTALGMIFGVAAVICMLSIGEGASAKQLSELRMLGSRNIILASIEPPSSTSNTASAARVTNYGLRMTDVNRIRALPFIEHIVLLRDVADSTTVGSKKFEGSVAGTTPNYFDLLSVRVARGRALSGLDDQERAKVCVLGSDVASVLFGPDDPLGKIVNVTSPSTNPIPYRVVGILAAAATAGTPAKGVGPRNVNRDVYIPWATADARYGEKKVKRSRGAFEMKEVELSNVFVSVEGEEQVMAVSQMIDRVLEHGHHERDFETTVPLALLRKAEQDKKLWQFVLGSIAGISLLVGGIGIMNIMLASVTERTREIGIRRALGAKRYHIIAQFLVETLILSIAGGMIGIPVGIGLSFLVTAVAQWDQTLIPWWAVVVSFFVSAAVGVSSGIYPAQAAAKLDPIQALRYD